jgi:hypothetical protein
VNAIDEDKAPQNKKRRFIGKGVLTWQRAERIMDRYGTVQLDDFPGEEGKMTPLRILDTCIGAKGRLIAVALETRKSFHVGDLFHGIVPSTPAIGEEIVLGEGFLFYEGDTFVGLRPEDSRETLWLDINKLYRAHDQTVELFFESL